MGKLIAYLRVSTKGQAEDGLGMEVQEQAIREWARANHRRVAEWHRDEGVSGNNGLESRVALPLALEAARAGGELVVYRLDRLARDLIVQETLLAELRRLGAVIHSTFPSEAGYLSDDPDDPSRKLIRQVLGAVSEYERAMTVLRLRMGRAHKARQGGYAYGSPPYGYRAEGKSLVPDPAAQAVLARMAELRGQGAGPRSIARTLNEEQVPAPRGQRWHPATVARVLAREQGHPAR